MSEHQRKIELQSTGDLAYLLGNIRATAKQKVDLHLPPSAAQGEDDTFRNKVEVLVQQYIHDTASLALPSLSINGLDALPSALTSNPDQPEPNDPIYEPYDTRLAQKLRDLYASLEEETTKVAGLRREAPRRATQAYIDALKQDLEVSEKEFEIRQAGLAQEQPPVLKDTAFSNNGDVKATWTQSKKDLEDLKNVTKVKANLERAIRAAKEVAKKKS